MRKFLQTAALSAVIWSTPALAVHSELYPVPYLGIGPKLLVTDSARQSGEGAGLYLTYGMPFDDHTRAIELRFVDVGYERPDGKKNYQSALFVDYAYSLGIFGRSEDAPFAYVKPFAIAGIGLIEEDVNSQKHIHLGIALGAGAIAPLGFNGWALRLDARAQPQVNNESIVDEDYLLDYTFNLGVQIPLPFYDRPVTVQPAEDCPVKVVNPDSGRTDCLTDSDSDGVLDGDDTCPGTAAGATVDEKGCPKSVREIPVENDGDKDGVSNVRDDCPDTQAGLKVDEHGCVVAQNTTIRGLTFELNSARLTSLGRTTLDGVTQTLAQQEDLRVEIAGHTDSIGSEAYNTLLSQQRSDSVKAYLVGKGIDGDRMTAVGYGELEPVASNDTDEGRKANRRVEFRITTD
ncbi:MAG TPA: OmpA family protein [Verrucomicrobiae bacterium]|nr:OmpA family protein [Verrucomicrobiae bacterium]